MPFRNASAYGDYNYAGFESPNAYSFGYDLGSDQFMSPYVMPLVSPQDSWTPTSLNQGSNSDALSPLEMSYAQSTPSVSGAINQDAVACTPSSDVMRQSDMLREDSLSTAQNATVSDHGRPQAGQKRNASHLAESQPCQPSATRASGRQNAKSNASPIDSASSSGNNVATRDGSQSLGEKPELTQARNTDSAKVRHNIVERRYRENINAQVDVLRDSIVATMQPKDDQHGTSSSHLGADELKRLTKAAVIAAATQQIKRARSSNEKLLEEHRALQAQIKTLESQVKCGECPLMQLTFDMGLEDPT